MRLQRINTAGNITRPEATDSHFVKAQSLARSSSAAASMLKSHTTPISGVNGSITLVGNTTNAFVRNNIISGGPTSIAIGDPDLVLAGGATNVTIQDNQTSGALTGIYVKVASSGQISGNRVVASSKRSRFRRPFRGLHSTQSLYRHIRRCSL